MRCFPVRRCLKNIETRNLRVCVCFLPGSSWVVMLSMVAGSGFKFMHCHAGTVVRQLIPPLHLTIWWYVPIFVLNFLSPDLQTGLEYWCVRASDFVCLVIWIWNSIAWNHAPWLLGSWNNFSRLSNSSAPNFYTDLAHWNYPPLRMQSSPPGLWAIFSSGNPYNI